MKFRKHRDNLKVAPMFFKCLHLFLKKVFTFYDLCGIMYGYLRKPQTNSEA